VKCVVAQQACSSKLVPLAVAATLYLFRRMNFASAPLLMQECSPSAATPCFQSWRVQDEWLSIFRRYSHSPFVHPKSSDLANFTGCPIGDWKSGPLDLRPSLLLFTAAARSVGRYNKARCLAICAVFLECVKVKLSLSLLARERAHSDGFVSVETVKL